MVHGMVLVIAVRVGEARREPAGLVESPAVQGREIARRDRVRRRIEVVQVGDQIPRGVADLAIRLCAARQDLFGDRVVVAVIEARDPETLDVGGVWLDEYLSRGLV